MVDALRAHLSALPAPQLARVARAVLGASAAATATTISAVEQRLLDETWLKRTLQELGPGAVAALAAVAHAGVPVLRKDVSALVAGLDTDPVDQLEEHGLIAPVRTGRGMPTHVVLTPGLEHLLAKPLASNESEGTEGSTFIGHRRRFDLALMLAITARFPPRLTKTGRPHSGDLKRLAAHLAPLGLSESEIERRLLRWVDLGIAQERLGALRVNALALRDVSELLVKLALAELAVPSVPEGALRVVERLIRSGGTVDLRTALDIAQAELLRSRSEDPDGPNRGARTELLEVARALLSLDALVLQDAAGHPVLLQDPDVLSMKTPPLLALEPSVAAALRGEPPPGEQFHQGHVQSSFEVVADSGCDPTVVAGVALWTELVRADRAAVLRLERASVVRAIELGFGLDQLMQSLETLAQRPPPANVVVLLKDWTAGVTVTDPLIEKTLPAMNELVRFARTAVLGANEG